MEVPYELLGRFFVFLAVAVLLATVLALLLGVYSFKRHQIVSLLLACKVDLQGVLHQRRTR
jgi:hypothetical protein